MKAKKLFRYNYNINNCPVIGGDESVVSARSESRINLIVNNGKVFLFNIFSFNIISSFVENSLIDVISQDKFYIRT